MMKKIILAVAGVSLCAVAWAGSQIYAYYGWHYMPGTTLNGHDVSGMTYDEAKMVIGDDWMKARQPLIVMARDDKEYKILPSDVGLDAVFDTSGAETHNGEARLKLKGADEQAGFEASLDDNMLKATLERTVFAEKGEEPVNAYIVKEEPGFRIEPEIEGSVIDDRESITQEISKAIIAGDTKYEVPESAYKEPAVRESSEQLQAELARLKSIEGAGITYDIRGVKSVLDWGTFGNWVSLDGTVDPAKAVEWAANLAAETDTVGIERTITLRDNEYKVKGPYGFKIDQEALAAEILQYIQAGEVIEKAPPYSQEAAAENNEIGNTFVEVDLSDQHVYLYSEGGIIADSPCVTGNASIADRITPPGIFPITYCQKDATLRGPGYASFVHYWMPFNGGIGLHDATWRGSFGGSIYKTNGSHGCVNLPLSFASTVFQYVKKGTCVIVHE